MSRYPRHPVVSHVFIALTHLVPLACGGSDTSSGPEPASAPAPVSAPAPAGTPATGSTPGPEPAASSPPLLLSESAAIKELLGRELTEREVVEAANQRLGRIPKEASEPGEVGVKVENERPSEVGLELAPSPAPSPSKLIRELEERGLNGREIDSTVAALVVESHLAKIIDDDPTFRAVYGDDDRYDIVGLSEVDASNVAILLDLHPSGQPIMPPLKMLRERHNLCRGERFAVQPTIQDACTAVLVRDDILATARHCVTPQEGGWAVFDYAIDNFWEEGQPIPRINAREFVTLPNDLGEDVALLKLKEPVKGRKPAMIRPVRGSRYVSSREVVFALGYPDGLPIKIVLSGHVTAQSHRRLTTDLDLFQGNSGSPIFVHGLNRHELVGIVVDGAGDYVEKEKDGCMVASRCLPPCTAKEHAVRGNIIADALEHIQR